MPETKVKVRWGLYCMVILILVQSCIMHGEIHEMSNGFCATEEGNDW